MVRLAPSYAIAKLEAGLVEHKLGTGGDAVTKEIVTKEFQMLFENKTNEIFEAIWNNDKGGTNNTGLRGSLFPRGKYPDEYDDDQYKDAAETTFQGLINTLDNKLFGFVKVK